MRALNLTDEEIAVICDSLDTYDHYLHDVIEFASNMVDRTRLKKKTMRIHKLKYSLLRELEP